MAIELSAQAKIAGTAFAESEFNSLSMSRRFLANHADANSKSK
jgi:hypothetical protein